MAGFQHGLVLVGQTGPEVFLRIKGWVDGGTDLSGDTDGKQVGHTNLPNLCMPGLDRAGCL